MRGCAPQSSAALGMPWGAGSGRSLGSIVAVASEDLDEFGVPGVTPTKRMASVDGGSGPSWAQLARWVAAARARR